MSKRTGCIRSAAVASNERSERAQAKAAGTYTPKSDIQLVKCINNFRECDSKPRDAPNAIQAGSIHRALPPSSLITWGVHCAQEAAVVGC